MTERTIVIVDDSEMVTAMLAFRLQQAGYNVLEAPDGDDAVQLLDGRPIDLVITDLNMPGMDGLQLIRHIRTTNAYQYLPVILFVSENAEDGENIESSGATALLVKADVNTKLNSLINRMVR